MLPALLSLAATVAVTAALPSYCSNGQPSIPALPAGAVVQQVQVFIRHGDRTLADASSCWPGDDFVWDCDLGVIQGPSQVRPCCRAWHASSEKSTYHTQE